jgi:hypothetical protein
MKKLHVFMNVFKFSTKLKKKINIKQNKLLTAKHV